MDSKSIASHNVVNPMGWMKGAGFDLILIVGVAVLALLSGLAFCFNPSLFPTILFFDLWFLGYHHVVATFTRLTFDLESFKENKFLIVWVPIILVAVIVPILYWKGSWILATTYLYWQWFHYTRQSYGISRIYQRKANRMEAADNFLENGIIYAVPILGIMYRSYQNPGKFLGVELKVIPVSELAMNVMFSLTLAILMVWLMHKIILFYRKQFDTAHTLYQISHLVIFWVGYIVIKDINHGWLVLNIWHNAQYILFVWMFNNNRFKAGVDMKRRFLSTLSQRRNLVLYFLFCISVAGIVYQSIEIILRTFTIATLPLAVLVYQTINFHHYVVDAFVWKIRKKTVQTTLGIQ